MTKLNQLLAVEKGVKSRTYETLTEIDRSLSKDALVRGITRNYRKKDDGDEDLPSESTLVQVRVGDALANVTEALTRQWDLAATKDASNTKALADIKLADGTTIAAQVPVTHLLFLEKQLTDVRTLVSRLPILDPQFEWTWDDAANCYRTQPQQTHRTKKLPRVLLRAEATKEHQAITDVYQEDVIVGYWDTTHLSGAIPAQERAEMLERVEELQRAVKTAREEANSLTVTDVKIAGDLLSHVFSKLSR